MYQSLPLTSAPIPGHILTPGGTMDVSIPSLLLGLGGKALLGIALLLFHQAHLNHSFLGVFSHSLTLVDTLLSLSLSALHLQGDCSVLGLRLTRHHICLLVQIASVTYDIVLWPVVILSGLDHYWTINTGGPDPTLRPPCSGKKVHLGGPLGSPPCSIPPLNMKVENTKLIQDERLETTLDFTKKRLPRWVLKMAYSAAVCQLWLGALLYVFLWSGVTPVLGDQSPEQLHDCWVFTSSQTSQVAGVLLLSLACALLYVHIHTGSLVSIYRGQRVLARANTPFWSHAGRQGRVEVVQQVLRIFIRTWAPFLLFLTVLLVCQVPGYLGLNVPLLCLLNSFLLGVVLWVRCPAPRLAQCSVTTDGFCNWRLTVEAH
ncbi:hypothetical protein UPYG_G00296230 [Umbra pygmaea]|uniref:G-protein coupled receptors family 1 profile domain-containing protein n=1 Tax=Umbra pygmaea TaxID=75934 RepID=A0ABD0W9V0_UMBPY